jgi:hypothetical protein
MIFVIVLGFVKKSKAVQTVYVYGRLQKSERQEDHT